MNTIPDWPSLSEVSEELDVPVSTLRLWINGTDPPLYTEKRPAGTTRIIYLPPETVQKLAERKAETAAKKVQKQQKQERKQEQKQPPEPAADIETALPEAKTPPQVPPLPETADGPLFREVQPVYAPPEIGTGGGSRNRNDVFAPSSPKTVHKSMMVSILETAGEGARLLIIGLLSFLWECCRYIGKALYVLGELAIMFHCGSRGSDWLHYKDRPVSSVPKRGGKTNAFSLKPVGTLKRR